MITEQCKVDEIISKAADTNEITDEELKLIINESYDETELFIAADKIRRKYYKTDVYLRGLIEFTNYCKNNCFYCGIRRDNRKVVRYRLSGEEIMKCCTEGYALGYRTFVLQGGEDPYFTDDRLCSVISEIRSNFPDCAITLSVGERTKHSYLRFFEAGAERYLLRHETADPRHYLRLHPADMSGENRKKCLYDLKEIGYQIGTGFMVGSPFQTVDNIVSDIRFMQEVRPDMIGIGPYITHNDTPFHEHPNGSVLLTLRLIAILRLLFPYALIPATTALGTLDPLGREKGLKAGANVVMPNLSPVEVRKKYELYENKICTGEESAQCRTCLERRINTAGYNVVNARGDVRRSQVLSGEYEV